MGPYLDRPGPHGLITLLILFYPFFFSLTMICQYQLSNWYFFTLVTYVWAEYMLAQVVEMYLDKHRFYTNKAEMYSNIYSTLVP